jgi:hypothetical protein
VDFRRWHGGKRLLFSTCNACKPEAPREGEVNELIFKARATAQAAKKSARLSDKALIRKQRERLREWNATILTPLRKEITWVLNAISTCRLGQAPHFATGALPPREIALAYASWQTFYEAYLVALREVSRRARNRLGLGRGGKLKPEPEDIDPMTYVFPETHAALRQLYSRCTPIPGRKSFREPWMLQWSETKGEKE